VRQSDAGRGALGQSRQGAGAGHDEVEVAVDAAVEGGHEQRVPTGRNLADEASDAEGVCSRRGDLTADTCVA
jgi:hypothetical protein